MHRRDDPPRSARRAKQLRAPLDAATRPGALPAPWDGLSWRPLAPVRNATKARVFVAERPDGSRVVCKDGSAARGAWARRLRRSALAREARILARLSGIEGVPELLGAWRGGLVMSFRPGRLLTEWPRGGTPPGSFDRLDGILAAIHARGIAVSDLHRRNILVDADGAVSVLDFELAVDGRRFGRRLLARRLQRLDRLAAARQRLAHGAPMSPEQHALVNRPPRWYLLLRSFKRWKARRARTKAAR